MLQESNVEALVAGRIRQIRKSKSLTLAQLSDRIGLSVALLSRIENKQSSPPIATLSKIASGLDVSISVFFEDSTESEKRYSVTRANKRKQIVRGGSRMGFAYQALESLAGPHTLESFVTVYPPIDEEPDLLFDHSGEELVFVLSGQIDLVLGNERIELSAGDAVHFDPSVPHRAQCKGQEAAHCLIVVAGDAGSGPNK